MSSAADIVLAAINAKWIHPSLALRLLKANLGGLAERCEILEFALRQPLKEKVEPILAARPRLLALSVSVWNHKAVLELLEALEKEWNEKPLVVLGGPEVSWLPEDVEIFRHVDYVIRGEAEESFRLLCYGIFYGERSPESLSRDLSVSDMGTGRKRTVFINRGDTTVNPDNIVPAYHLYTDEDLKRKLVYVEASRGCAFACEFCQAAVRHNNEALRVREFPLEPFLADMGKLIDRGGRTFKFLDRTFNLDMDRVKRIMEFFLERIEADATIRSRPLCVHFEMVPFNFPPALKEIIRRFPPGTLRLELGIQTFNAETAALIHRSGNPGAELEILRFLRRETNAILHVDLIAGLPGEDLVSFGDGFDRLWQVLAGKFLAGERAAGNDSSFEIQLGILKCLPGTAIARHNEKYGMKYSTEPPYEVIETAALCAAELGRIKNFARFWEIIVNRNPFPEMINSLLPPEEPVFDRFMHLSDNLIEHFGKNWGIDRQELRNYLGDCSAR